MRLLEVSRLVPILDWIPRYRREWLLPDVFAGVALGNKRSSKRVQALAEQSSPAQVLRAGLGPGAEERQKAHSSHKNIHQQEKTIDKNIPLWSISP
jgi:hypothetical protein